MSEQTPSQAEGERQQSPRPDEQETPGRRDVPRTPPSQAEGAQDEDRKRSEEWEAGWSGP
jgi:hypothetical protein